MATRTKAIAPEPKRLWINPARDGGFGGAVGFVRLWYDVAGGNTMSSATKELELLTVKQAANLLHLDERTIRNHINRSRLRASKLPGGKGWLIRREDLLTALQPLLSQTTVQTGVVPAGTDPLSVETSGVVRRTNTPEGRARAIAVLDQLWADKREQEPEALEQPLQTRSPIQFRRWNVETWEPLGKDEN